MSQRSNLAAIVMLAGVVLLAAACSTSSSQPSAAPVKSVTTASATVAPRPEPTHTATHRPARTVTATLAPSEMVTPTLLPVEWLVNARELPDVPPGGGQAAWIDSHTVAFEPYDDEVRIQYDLSQLPVARADVAVPPLFHNADDSEILFSPKQTYAVLCTEKNEQDRPSYGSLQLYHVAEDRLISQVTGVVVSCPFSLRWSRNETVLSFASARSDVERDSTDIYAWKTDGSQPYVIGQGTYLDEPGTWSPDVNRLVVEVYNWDATQPEDEYTYRIMYLDGRPSRQTQAQLGTRAQPGLSWLNEEIVNELNVYITCGYHDYYLVDTGERLENMSWSDWGCGLPFYMDNQRPLISDDQHWFVLDQSEGPIDVPLIEFTYTLYDLKTHRRYPLSKSEEVFLEFAGWVDNSNFYLIRRPASDPVTAQPAAPFGLLALDPNTRQMRLIHAEIRHGWLNPDKTLIFGLIPNDGRLNAALYALDGTALTTSISLAMPEVLAFSELPKLHNYWDVPGVNIVWWAWSPDGRKIAIRDTTGALWVIDAEKGAKQLAKNLTLFESPFYSPYHWQAANTSELLWSPEGDHLMIQSGKQVWVVDFEE